jgi:hypothetical protein
LSLRSVTCWIRFQLTPFNAGDQVSQHSVRAADDADLLAFAHQESILVRRPFCMS